LIQRAFASDSVAGRRLALIILISLALVMPAMWPSTARADDGPAKPNVPVSHTEMTADERAQVPLVKAADELQALVEKHKLPGFAGVAIQIDKRSVELFWKGTVPGVMNRAITKLRGGVAVTVTPAAYSLKELDREAKRVASQNLDSVVEVGPTADYSGLEVVTDEALGLAAARRAITSTVPMTFKTGKPAQPAYARWDDSEPFWGGNAIDRLVNPILRTYTYCTSAFAGRRSNGQETLITARHCGQNVDWTTPSSADRFVGRAESGNASLDATVMTGADYNSVMYVGPTNSTTGRVVRGSGNPADNTVAITSGSWSGAAVANVRGVNRYVNVTDVGTVGPGFWTEDTAGVASVGQGDSGGPVASAIDTQTVAARGMISAIDSSQIGTCVGRVTDGRQCSFRSFHVNISNIASAFGMVIQTS